MRAPKVQASLRIRTVSPEPLLLAHTSSESRGTFRQKARSLAPLNGWACAVKICHDGMLEDTNSLDGAHMLWVLIRTHLICCTDILLGIVATILSTHMFLWQWNKELFLNWALSSEFVSSSIPSWQIPTAHAQPFRGATDLAFCLKVPLDSLLLWDWMCRLAWTFAAGIGDKYQIRLTRSNYHQIKYLPYLFILNLKILKGESWFWITKESFSSFIEKTNVLVPPKLFCY